MSERERVFEIRATIRTVRWDDKSTVLNRAREALRGRGYFRHVEVDAVCEVTPPDPRTVLEEVAVNLRNFAAHSLDEPLVRLLQDAARKVEGALPEKED